MSSFSEPTGHAEARRQGAAFDHVTGFVGRRHYAKDLCSGILPDNSNRCQALKPAGSWERRHYAQTSAKDSSGSVLPVHKPVCTTGKRYYGQASSQRPHVGGMWPNGSHSCDVTNVASTGTTPLFDGKSQSSGPSRRPKPGGARSTIGGARSTIGGSTSRTAACHQAVRFSDITGISARRHYAQTVAKESRKGLLPGTSDDATASRPATSREVCHRAQASPRVGILPDTSESFDVAERAHGSSGQRFFEASHHAKQYAELLCRPNLARIRANSAELVDDPGLPEGVRSHPTIHTPSCNLAARTCRSVRPVMRTSTLDHPAVYPGSKEADVRSASCCEPTAWKAPSPDKIQQRPASATRRKHEPPSAIQTKEVQIAGIPKVAPAEACVASLPTLLTSKTTRAGLVKVRGEKAKKPVS